MIDQARLPAIHARQLVEVLECFAKSEKAIEDLGTPVFTTMMWNETNAQLDRTISRSVRFAESLVDHVYSGPHVGVANPLFKTRDVRRVNNHYDAIDLTSLGVDYLPRTVYRHILSMSIIDGLITPYQIHRDIWLKARNWVGSTSERTLVVQYARLGGHGTPFNSVGGQTVVPRCSTAVVHSG